MYIVAIGWLYVVLMMAIASHSILAGLANFLFLGVVPLALFLWIVGTPARRRRRAMQAGDAPPQGPSAGPGSPDRKP